MPAAPASRIALPGTRAHKRVRWSSSYLRLKDAARVLRHAYLGTLSTRSDVLALAFHVDYWDSLGWRDRFELPKSVERQNVSGTSR